VGRLRYRTISVSEKMVALVTGRTSSWWKWNEARLSADVREGSKPADSRCPRYVRLASNFGRGTSQWNRRFCDRDARRGMCEPLHTLAHSAVL